MSEHAARRRPSRVVPLLALLVVVVVVIVVVLKATGGGSSSGASRGVSDDDSGVPTEPDSAPVHGSYVASTVAKDGTVSVRHWIRSGSPIRTLQLSTVDPETSQPDTASAVDVVVRGLDGSVLARSSSVGSKAVRLRLRDAVPNLYLTYQVHDAVDAAETAHGRMLANVLGMDVGYSGASGTVQHLVTGPGQVLNVACLRVSAPVGTPPKPCGAPTKQGGWLVVLHGIDRTDRLVAQVSATGGATTGASAGATPSR